MFDPTDPSLLKALLATSDRGKLLYGLLNSIGNPAKGKKSKDAADAAASGEPPPEPTAATQVKIDIYNRSRRDQLTIAYDYFRPGMTPAGFLPELSAVDMTARSTLGPAKPSGKRKRPPPAVHIHHKFIVIDADTDAPTIFTGSANLSKNSTNFNDENLLEITGSPALAQTYFAEFMRLYEHYRSRAIWDQTHRRVGPKKRGPLPQKTQDTFTLKTKRDAWVRRAYQRGTPEYVARTTLAQEEA
jgi:phosphatidylserine/phosphatidylglycerophosphate/cardiolipin synthase-like enzyme